ncbi:MAG: ASCH domain-containing protein [Planktomarina sp.]
MTDDTEYEDLNDRYPGAGTFMFGEDRVSCDRQLALVRGKSKSAMCAPLSDFEGDEDAMPKVGRCDIATEWDGTPAAVIKTTRVDKVTFNNVTGQMAIADGVTAGGPRDSLDAWRKMMKTTLTTGGAFDPNMMLVFEHFELIENLGDRPNGE